MVILLQYVFFLALNGAMKVPEMPTVMMNGMLVKCSTKYRATAASFSMCSS